MKWQMKSLILHNLGFQRWDNFFPKESAAMPICHNSKTSCIYFWLYVHYQQVAGDYLLSTYVHIMGLQFQQQVILKFSLILCKLDMIRQ